MLESLYEPQNLARKLMLNHKLYSLKMSKGASIDDFIRDVMDVVNQLKSVGEVTRKENFVQIMLGAMPDSYESFIQGMLTQDLTQNSSFPVLKILLARCCLMRPGESSSREEKTTRL